MRKPAPLSSPSTPDLIPSPRSRFGRGVIWTLICTLVLNPVLPALGQVVVARYFAHRFAPITQAITATVTPSMPGLTVSCSNEAASAKPKKGCNNWS